MILARVVGHAVSALHHPSLRGARLLICESVDTEGRLSGKPMLCADWQGAGLHDDVFITTDGESVQPHITDPHCPLRNVIVGLIDRKEAAGADG